MVVPPLPALLPRSAWTVATQRETVRDKRPIGGAVLIHEPADSLVFLGGPHAAARGQGNLLAAAREGGGGRQQHQRQHQQHQQTDVLSLECSIVFVTHTIPHNVLGVCNTINNTGVFSGPILRGFHGSNHCSRVGSDRTRLNRPDDP